MASHRAITTGTALSTAVNGPELGPQSRDEAHTAGERLLKRAGLYARVSTEKQEREETVASQVDFSIKPPQHLCMTVAPGNIFINEGGSGTRLERLASDRLIGLVTDHPKVAARLCR